MPSAARVRAYENKQYAQFTCSISSESFQSLWLSIKEASWRKNTLAENYSMSLAGFGVRKSACHESENTQVLIFPLVSCMHYTRYPIAYEPSQRYVFTLQISYTHERGEYVQEKQIKIQQASGLQYFHMNPSSDEIP